MRDYLKNIDPNNIEESPTKSNITYKYKGRNICTIDPRKDYFWMGWRDLEGTWVTEGDITSFDEAKDIIDEEITNSYKHLKQNR